MRDYLHILHDSGTAVTADGAGNHTITVEGSLMKRGVALDLDNQLGDGEPVFFEGIVRTAWTGTGTITFKLQETDDDLGGSPTWSDVVASADLDADAYVAGDTLFSISVPKGPRKKHFRCYHDVTGTVAAGIYEAGFAID